MIDFSNLRLNFNSRIVLVPCRISLWLLEFVISCNILWLYDFSLWLISSRLILRLSWLGRPFLFCLLLSFILGFSMFCPWVLMFVDILSLFFSFFLGFFVWACVEHVNKRVSAAFAPYRVRPYLIPCSPPHFSSSTPPSRVRPQIESCLN